MYMYIILAVELTFAVALHSCKQRHVDTHLWMMKSK